MGRDRGSRGGCNEVVGDGGELAQSGKLAVNGGREAGEGLRSAWIRSRVTAMTVWVEEWVGMTSCVGNQASVSVMRLVQVSSTQTW